MCVGARALGAVLSGKSGLRMIDLRGNKIGKGAVRILAEALERSERVRHVYVHAGGKIEALGASRWAKPRSEHAPEETADNLKKYGGFVPGIRPGKNTAEYLDYVLTRLTVVGASYLAIICLLPELLISKYFCIVWKDLKFHVYCMIN